MNSQQQFIVSSKSTLFENAKALLTPKEVSSILGIAPATIYDWKYRSILRKVPTGLFIKFNRKLFIRTEVLKHWILSQN